MDEEAIRAHNEAKIKKELEKIKADLPHLLKTRDDFEFGDAIGEGGFGKVYKAKSKENGNYYAVKEIFARRIEGKQFKRFLQEIRTMEACHHPFLLDIFGFTAEDPYSIITPMMTNGALSQFIGKKGLQKLGATQLTKIVMGIAAGMAHVHKCGIVHRDLKPGNVLLDKDNLPKICDFGVARFKAQAPGQVMTMKIGTPCYMAPELFDTGKYTVKVDVYSFGIMLFEICEGRRPFYGLNLVQTRQKVFVNREREPMTHKTPRAIQRLIEMCWAHDACDRPSMREIYELFATGQISFRETDKKEIQKFADKVKEMEAEYAAKFPPPSKKRAKRRPVKTIQDIPPPDSPIRNLPPRFDESKYTSGSSDFSSITSHGNTSTSSQNSMESPEVSQIHPPKISSPHNSGNGFNMLPPEIPSPHGSGTSNMMPPEIPSPHNSGNLNMLPPDVPSPHNSGSSSSSAINDFKRDMAQQHAQSVYDRQQFDIQMQVEQQQSASQYNPYAQQSYQQSYNQMYQQQLLEQQRQQQLLEQQRILEQQQIMEQRRQQALEQQRQQQQQMAYAQQQQQQQQAMNPAMSAIPMLATVLPAAFANNNKEEEEILEIPQFNQIFIPERPPKDRIPKSPPASNPNDPSSVLADYNAPLFMQYLVGYGKILEPGQFAYFGPPIVSLFAYNPPVWIMETVVKTCHSMMSRSEVFVKLFNDAGFFEKIDIYESQFIDIVVDCFKLLCLSCPEAAVSDTLSGQVEALMEVAPEKTLIMYSIIPSQKPSVRFSNQTLKVLLESAFLLKETAIGGLAVRLVYWICKESEQSRAFLVGEMKHFMFALMAADEPETASAALKASVHLLDNFNGFEPETVLKHLERENLSGLVISVLLRVQNLKPTEALVKSLVVASRTLKSAWVVLFRFANSAISFPYKEDFVYDECDIQPFEIFRLILALFGTIKIRSDFLEVPKFYQLLVKTVRTDNEFYVHAIPSIVNRQVVLPRHVQMFSDCGFIAEYISFMERHQSLNAYNDTLVIVSKLAMVAYAPQFNSVAKTLMALLRDQTLYTRALKVISLVTKYPEFRAVFPHDQATIAYFGSLMQYPACAEDARIIVYNLQQ